MAAIINLEMLPALVLDKITSFLNHKQLLALEQVSRKLKCAVDTHFSLTDHLIIGALPGLHDYCYDYEQDVEVNAKDKKSLHGFHKIIMRCGSRLRTIQITMHDEFCRHYRSLTIFGVYFRRTFASHETSNNCPNIENIIASPSMDDDCSMLHEQNVLLHFVDTECYANNIKTSTGESCKLRGISLITPFNYPGGFQDHSYERIVNLFPNLEQMTVWDYGDSFYKFLPQFIENGLKDLSTTTKVRNAKTYCAIGKNLRTLNFNLSIKSDDVAALNQQLHLPKNVKLTINQQWDEDFLPQLSENICNSVREFDITKSEHVKVIADESFPELKRISCINCENITYFTQLLTNKGNQLTDIYISFSRGIEIDVAWQALKHCRAAKNVRFSFVCVDSHLSVTAEDMRAICRLPNLQHFVFIIMLLIEQETCRQLRDLMKTTVKEHLDFQFKYECESRDDDSAWVDQTYSLCRIH